MTNRTQRYSDRFFWAMMSHISHIRRIVLFRVPSALTVSLCWTYLVVAGLLPVVDIQHAFEVDSDGGPHAERDVCTWIQHAIGSSACSDAGVNLVVLAKQQPRPSTPLQRLRSRERDAALARGPPALLP